MAKVTGMGGFFFKMSAPAMGPHKTDSDHFAPAKREHLIENDPYDA